MKPGIGIKLLVAIIIGGALVLFLSNPVIAAQTWIIIHHEAQGVADQSWTRCKPDDAWIHEGHSIHDGDWRSDETYSDNKCTTVIPTATNTAIFTATAIPTDTALPTSTLVPTETALPTETLVVLTATSTGSSVTETPGSSVTETPTGSSVTETPGSSVTETPGTLPTNTPDSTSMTAVPTNVTPIVVSSPTKGGDNSCPKLYQELLAQSRNNPNIWSSDSKKPTMFRNHCSNYATPMPKAPVTGAGADGGSNAFNIFMMGVGIIGMTYFAVHFLLGKLIPVKVKA